MNEKYEKHDVEVPQIVMDHMEDAFSRIKEVQIGQEGFEEHVIHMDRGGNVSERTDRQRTPRWRFRRSATAVACAAVLALSGITVAAATWSHLWGKPMSEYLQVSEDQQQVLAEQGVATVLNAGETDAEDVSAAEVEPVTVDGVTIRPTVVITDDHYTHIAFTIENYQLPENADPAFEYVDHPHHLNSSSGFYDGRVSNGEGMAVYADGSEVEEDEQGRSIVHYEDENGNLTYIIDACNYPNEGSLIDQNCLVTFKNLGYTTEKMGELQGVVEGEWSFEIPLGGNGSCAGNPIQLNQPIEGTSYELRDVVLSPLSISLNYDVTGEINWEKYDTMEIEIPELVGIVLQDGTRIMDIGAMGSSGLKNENTEAYQSYGFSRVLNPEEVKALVILTGIGDEYYEVELP